MKYKGAQLALVIISSVFLSGCLVSTKKSAIEINSYPVAKVYIDGKEMGLTPYRNRQLKPGEIEVRLITNESEWTKKIKLQNNISTVVDWELAKPKTSQEVMCCIWKKLAIKKVPG